MPEPGGAAVGLGEVAADQAFPSQYRYMPGWPPGSGYHPAWLLTAPILFAAPGHPKADDSWLRPSYWPSKLILSTLRWKRMPAIPPRMAPIRLDTARAIAAMMLIEFEVVALTGMLGKLLSLDSSR